MLVSDSKTVPPFVILKSLDDLYVRGLIIAKLLVGVSVAWSADVMLFNTASISLPFGFAPKLLASLKFK